MKKIKDYLAYELAEELEVTYEPVKIGVLANSENVENAVKWLTKLAEELS